MSSPPPAPLSQLFTQAVQNLAKGRLGKKALKKGAIVPELWVKDPISGQNEVYSLIGDRYTLGRSSQVSDITIGNPIVSQQHCSLHRDKAHPRHFILQDEHSTNGVYLGRRKIKSLPLKHGDRLSLGPPELKDAVKITYHYPPPSWVRVLRYGLYGAGGLFALATLWVGMEWTKISVYPLPTGVTGPVVIYAGDGVTPLNPTQKAAHQELKKIADFSPYLPKAVIASEDSRFYWHFGVDPFGLVRAVWVNFQKGGIRQGASTLTQQVARSLFPEVGRDYTAERKLREMAVSLKLEAFYSKDAILNLYLNRVYLGGGNYGFEDAARFYFDKSARDLTLSEAATLVAMLPAPNRYNPVQNYDAAVQLRNRVIGRMAQLGMVTSEAAAQARRSRIEVSPKAKKAISSIRAPYFYSYVFQELRELLGDELAKEGNFIVETSINLSLQAQADRALVQATANPSDRISQGAIVTLDSRKGEILSLTGGVDYQQSQFNRATLAQRQPGSTFKVFTYAAALEQGISPDRVYSCAALSWRGQEFKPCERTSGSANLYRGIAQSENAIALRVAQEVGLDRIISLAQKMGIHSPLRSAPGLVLGQSEVNLLELTGAYDAFANNGVWSHPHGIRRILDGNDCKNPQQPKTCREIYNFAQDKSAQKQVISPATAQTMTTLLRGVVQSGTGRSAAIGMGEAGKTGTTNNGVDLWFIGYIPQRDWVTGVWLGNDNNAPTGTSSVQAAALWGSYMGAAVKQSGGS